MFLEVILSAIVRNKVRIDMLPNSELIPGKSCMNLVHSLTSIYRVIHEESQCIWK